MRQLVLVSDDEGLQQLVRSVATNAGWSVRRAPQATELLPHELDEADLLVVDLSAPCALDDLSTLRADRAALPILAVADADDPRAAGIDLPLVALPCTTTALAAALQAALVPVVDLRESSEILAS